MSNSRNIQRDRENKNLVSSVFRILFDSGTHALIIHRVAYFICKLGVPVIPAIIRRINIFFTGADIHPGAVIDKGVYIIHSVGIVIGKGTRVKTGCEIFGGVTLGGRGGNRADDGNPVIEKNSVLCAGAIIIGNINIGRNVTVAAGSVVLESVKDNVMVAGNPAMIKERHAK